MQESLPVSYKLLSNDELTKRVKEAQKHLI